MSQPIDWLDAFLSLHPELKNEARYEEASRAILKMLGCSEIENQYEFSGYRVDVKGVLPNGHYVLVECKDFGSNAAPFVDSVMQAASYADAIQYPVFVGPIRGSKSTIISGRIEDGLSILHLIAGRLNVGFLCVSDTGSVQLILRGQVLASSRTGLHSQFSTHWGYTSRNGSKTIKK